MRQYWKNNWSCGLQAWDFIRSITEIDLNLYFNIMIMKSVALPKDYKHDF